MKLASFEAIVAEFDAAGVRYLVAGGLAVNAYGYLQLTKDVDGLSPHGTDHRFAVRGCATTTGLDP